MIAPFTLDTSGAVAHPSPETSVIKAYRWVDLDAFTQGYVEALLSCSRGKCLMVLAGGDLDNARPVAFSDLAPETLALILEDCAAYQAKYLRDYEATPDRAASFWSWRQAEKAPEDRSAEFPPLTPYLGDGKVYLREGA